MRIGIDIDGVLTNLRQFHIDYVSKYCVLNNIDYDIDLSKYDIASAFNISKEDDYKFWEKYLEYYAKNEGVRPFAKEIIDKLISDGHKIYIITARWNAERDDEVGEKMRNIVKSWLEKEKINYDKLIFVKSSKLQYCIDEKIDIMIDDDVKNINQLSEVIPVICYDAPYNRNCNYMNVIRCYSWYDIYKKISKER